MREAAENSLTIETSRLFPYDFISFEDHLDHDDFVDVLACSPLHFQQRDANCNDDVNFGLNASIEPVDVYQYFNITIALVYHLSFLQNQNEVMSE